MPTSPDPSDRSAPHRFRRIAPALVLFFLAPFIAEFLLGNISISAIGALLFLAPLYGGGAVAVREVARRAGRGWATIVLLALAYGLIEEGIVIQTLFNPNYLGLHLLSEDYMPALGIGGWWTLFVLTLHTVWSISVPIAIVEGLFATRRETPWLGNLGLGVSILLLLVGGVLIRVGTTKQDPFTASPLQLVSTGVIIIAVIIAAFRCRKSRATRVGFTPHPAIVGVITFGLGLAFMSAHAVLHGWIIVPTYLAIYLVAAALLITWSRNTRWTPTHTLAAGGGAMLTYACTAFPQVPVIGAKGTVDLVGNGVFGVIAATLLIMAVKAQRKAGASFQL